MQLFLKRTGSATLVAVVAVLLLASVAFAATYSLFGDAEIVSPGNSSPHAVKLTSTCPGGYPSCIDNGTYTYSGVDFDIPSGTTFATLGQLSTDFFPEPDDLCIGGSPRFQIEVQTPNGPRNIFAYFGPDSGSPACVPNTWQNTTDLLQAGKLLDTSQLSDFGGFYGQEYSLAVAAFGSYPVLSVQVVVDAGWAHSDNEQTFIIDNTLVDDKLYTYDQPISKEDCKNGGWKTLTRADGSTFKNQGDCIQYVNTGK